MCFVWISEQTTIISLYNINWLVFITETECVYCAVRTIYIYICVCVCVIQVNPKRTALFWAVTQPVVVISYQRFGTTCRSHLQTTLMWPIGCPETSLMNYDYWLCNNPEERASRWKPGITQVNPNFERVARQQPADFCCHPKNHALIWMISPFPGMRYVRSSRGKDRTPRDTQFAAPSGWM